MSKEETIENLHEILQQMEKQNACDGVSLMYNFRSFFLRDSIVDELNRFYRGHSVQIRPIDHSLKVIEEALFIWFFEPLSSLNPPFSQIEEYVTPFLTQLEYLLDTETYTIYEISVPFDFVGAYSEHFAICQNDRLYVLQFTVI